jgi:apolipoprotein N-acyltransferase
MNSVVLSIISAVLLSLSFSSFNLWFFAWFGFIPLFIALENKSLRRAIVTSYLCGVIFWSLTIYWLIHVTLLGTVILVLYLALYFSFFGLGIALSGDNIIFIPCWWVLLEYIRSYLFTGFPWALLGFSQYKNLPAIQIADITGVWGVSFLVILVNVMLYSVLSFKLSIPGKIKKLIILILCLGVVLTYGYCKIHCSFPSKHQQLIRISVIQGNIPQDLKWSKQAVNFIQDRYEELTVASAGDKPDLIIWPEASVPAIWPVDTPAFARVFSLARRKDINLLIGAVSSFGKNYYNSALFIDKTGTGQEIYNKLHLVPFGEFVPLRNIFPFLESLAPVGDITAGNDYTIFKQPAPFGVLICFEDLFPKLSCQFARKGAKLLVNITNDAWYKKSSAPYQHFAASVFRAIENRLYLVRSANTGISGFIDPFGRILAAVHDAKAKKIFVAGYKTQNIYLNSPRRTFYNRCGDFLIVLCLLVVAYAIYKTAKKRRFV